MCEFIIVLKFTVSDVCIYLCGCERGVAEELLYGAYRGSGVEHVGCERVAQYMRAQSGGMDVFIAQSLMYDIVDQFAIEWFPIFPHEKRGLTVVW